MGDDGSLQRNMRLAKEIKVEDFVSAQTEDLVMGLQPQDRQIVLVIPMQPCAMEVGADVRIARGGTLVVSGQPLTMQGRSSIERKHG